MKRYTIGAFIDRGNFITEEDEDPEGKWVKYEDVLKLLEEITQYSETPSYNELVYVLERIK